MKKMYLAKLPTKLVSHFAKWTYENGITIQVSYTNDEFFEGTKVYSYAIVPEETEAKFVNEFKNHITAQ